MEMKRIYWLLLPLIALSCSRSQDISDSDTTRSFYYWKSTFQMEHEDTRMLDSLQISKLYIRFFDVKPHSVHKAVPVAPITFKSDIPYGIDYVPTVFITNETLKGISIEDARELARKIYLKICNIQSENALPNFNEIQIDCDWTKSTRAKYFALLSSLKGKEKLETVSATIRLHQVKYKEECGIPPVDRGTLMYYNMGKISDPETTNSIIDNEEGSKYIDRKSTYPVPLDLALPMYSWGVLFRDGKIKSILHGLTRDEMTHAPYLDLLNYEENVHSREYEVAYDHVFHDQYLREGDRVRLEDVHPEVLRDARKVLKPLFRKGKPYTLTLYHWQSESAQRYEDIETVYRHYR